MLTENDVINAVAEHLPSLGYAVESRCTTYQRGIDIVAKHKLTGRRLRIEAKGGTSSKKHTPGYGQPFKTGPIESHVSRGLYEAAVMLGAYPADHVALALPDDSQHRGRVDEIRSALDRLGIAVFFVAGDRTVQLTGNLPTA